VVAAPRSCDRLRVASLSWRRFRKLFGLYVKDFLVPKRRERLAKDARFLTRLGGLEVPEVTERC